MDGITHFPSCTKAEQEENVSVTWPQGHNIIVPLVQERGEIVAPTVTVTFGAMPAVSVILSPHNPPLTFFVRRLKASLSNEA